MDMIKIFGIGLTGAVLALILKEYKPVFAVCTGCITALSIFIMLLPKIGYVLDIASMIAGRMAIEAEYIQIIIRIIGITYLAGFGSELCRDAGQNAIAKKIELAGKIMIIVASMPIFTAVLNLLVGLLPTV